LRLRRRNADIRRRNELELEEQRRRYRGFYRTPSPSNRQTHPKNRRPFLPPSLPVDQTKKQTDPIAGPSGIRLPGIRQMQKPRVPMPQPPVAVLGPPAQAPQVQPPVRPPPPSFSARPNRDPLEKANEAWKEAGNLKISLKISKFVKR
jgi:hypothetical protein